MLLFPLVASSMPSRRQRFMVRPRTVLLPAVMTKPVLLVPALVPLISISGEAAYPGSLAPSIKSGSEMAGRAESSAMVLTPAPAMLNRTVSAPGAALASRMACRRLPAPLSAVAVTVKLASRSRGSTDSINEGADLFVLFFRIMLLPLVQPASERRKWQNRQPRKGLSLSFNKPCSEALRLPGAAND